MSEAINGRVRVRARVRAPGARSCYKGTVPLQNRVSPDGELHAVPSRGTLMGNRGCIHRPDRTLGVSRWRTPMWISCVLVWRDVRRDVMPPGRWTALFFLDEATALAAGHRPCGYCRRDRHREFGELWRAATGLAERPLAHEMDLQLHTERVESRTRRKITRPARLGELPDGAMVRLEAAAAAAAAGARGDDPFAGPQCALVLGGRLLPWSFEGYGVPSEISADTKVELLTPPTIASILAAGYRPLLHPSAAAAVHGGPASSC